MRVLVTGAVGFIGYHLCRRLLEHGHEVTGLDNLNDYYDPRLKRDRLRQLELLPEAANFNFCLAALEDQAPLSAIFASGGFSHVVNLAAQAGVRHSLRNPAAYIASNLVGFGNLLEQSRNAGVGHLVFASSSSIYGINTAQPYSPHQNTDHPLSLYAATKKSNELMAHSYSHLFNLPCTGLRFFTVYGPWGRPDMALHLFTSAILKGEPLRVFNNGRLKRDFTYIDDIIDGIVDILDKPARPDPQFDPAKPDPASSLAPWRIYNIGNNQPVTIEAFIGAIEDALGKKAIRQYLPMQPGDVESTWADIDDFAQASGFRPHTGLGQGIQAYVNWHREYYGDC